MKIIAISLLLILAGCASVHIKTDRCEASISSLFKSADTAKVCGATVSGPTVNTETLGALLQVLSQ